MSNALTLLAETFQCLNWTQMQAAAIIELLNLHPNLPLLWEKLATVYDSLDNSAAVADQCRIRASRFKASFEKTLPSSFVKDSFFEKTDSALKVEGKDKKDGTEVADAGEFVDLGSTKYKLAKKEKVSATLKSTKKELPHPPAWLEDAEALKILLHHHEKHLLSFQ